MTPSQIADPLIGRLVDDRYRVRARIARGGMATVYVATDLRLERRIALKVMHQHLSDDSVFQSRFIQEARAAARLADPHVVNVFDQGQDGELAYLVMEYLPGITLRELLKEQRRLSVSQTITIMDAILSGLAAAHRAGIVHRDVKPENVLLAEDGRIKIGDFGLARATTANTATGQQLMGTIAYLAPELVTRGTADARSDIYALGIMMYEMLTGEQPYRGEQPMQIAFQHATESVPRPSVRNPGVPEPLDELVLWATEREPDERPLDAQVMLDRLREIEHDLGISPVVARRETTTMTAGLAIPDDAPTGGITTVMPMEREPSRATVPVDSSDNATRLRQVGQRNRRKGAWLLLLVLLLASVAGGAAWWFGSGPGSLVAVPQVASKTWEQASETLTAAGFKPEQASEASRDVQSGLVIRTDPAAGMRLDKESKISVVVSTGPAPTTVASLEGKKRAEVTDILKKHFITLAGDASEEFNADVPADTVMTVSITPAAGGDAVACISGCQVHEDDTATMLVSLGPVADVVGKTVADATKALTAQGLKVSQTPKEEYSETAPAGQVIRMEGAVGDTGAWKKGDTAVLVVSLGLPPIEVPDVNGMVVTDAVAKLEELGFKVKVNFPRVLWPATKVTAFTPGAGTTLTKGSEIAITDVAVNIG